MELSKKLSYLRLVKASVVPESGEYWNSSYSVFSYLDIGVVHYLWEYLGSSSQYWVRWFVSD